MADHYPTAATYEPQDMLADARLLAHLLHIYRIRDRLQRAEWTTDAGAPLVSASSAPANGSLDGLA